VTGLRLAITALAAAAALALLAPALAGDRPLLLRQRGALSMPVVDGQGVGGDPLRAELGPDDWALWPPIAHDPDAVRTDGAVAPLAPPSARHWLGTDDRGRDVAARLIHGTRTSVAIAAAAAALATAFAVLLALIAVRAGGAVDAAVRTTCDAIAAAPPILTVIAAQGLLGSRGVAAVIALIAIPRAADSARLVRARLRAVLATPFCDAARAAGASPARVLVRHGLPHAAPVLATAAAVTAATAVLAEAGLAFLGVGAPPPTASWGELLAQATANDLRWWLALPAGAAVTALTAALLAVARRAGAGAI
jgi:ABC-type dipeptide/oligopeptide/nickel transport system permease subunit